MSPKKLEPSRASSESDLETFVEGEMQGPRCESRTGGGRYQCGRPAGHEGKHRGLGIFSEWSDMCACGHSREDQAKAHDEWLSAIDAAANAISMVAAQWPGSRHAENAARNHARLAALRAFVAAFVLHSQPSGIEDLRANHGAAESSLGGRCTSPSCPIVGCSGYHGPIGGPQADQSRSSSSESDESASTTCSPVTASPSEQRERT